MKLFLGRYTLSCQFLFLFSKNVLEKVLIQLCVHSGGRVDRILKNTLKCENSSMATQTTQSKMSRV